MLLENFGDPYRIRVNSVAIIISTQIELFKITQIELFKITPVLVQGLAKCVCTALSSSH